MGGGLSRLETTDWETADGKLDGESIQQTIDGTLPIHKFGLYEIQKKTVGQREFDVVNKDLELIYTTKSVPGTVSWFDVLGPGSCGDYVDSKLRVTSDIARRTWIIYRYHLPLFEGQKPCSDPAVVKGLQEGVLLYRTACITVSWSRYIAVAARYGPPDLSDFLDVAVESPNRTTNDNNEADGDNIGDDDSDAIQSPHELHLQKQHKTPSLQKEESSGDDPLFAEAQQIAARHRNDTEDSVASKTGTAVVAAAESVVEEDSTSKHDIERKDVVGNTTLANTIDVDKAGDESDKQGTYFDGSSDKPEVKESATTRTDDESCIEQGSNNSIQSTDDDPSKFTSNENSTNEETDTIQIKTSRSSSSQDSNEKSVTSSQQLPTKQMKPSQSFGNSSRSSRMLPATTLTTSVKAAAAAAAAASKNGSLSSSMMSGGGNSRRRLRDYFSSSKSSSLSLNATASGSQDTDDILEVDEKEDEAERLKREAMELNFLYELALEGVIDLDTQPIMQCQEVYNKMIGNHQTFLMTKDEVIELLRIDEKQHEEQLEQQHSTGETIAQDSDDTGINPMVKAVELDAKHKEQDSQQTPQSGSSPRSRWMSRWSSIRSVTPSGAAASPAAGEVPNDMSSNPIEEATEDVSTADDNPSPSQQSGGRFGSGRRIRSSWNRMFSSSNTSTTSIAATEATRTIAEESSEEPTQSFEVSEKSPTGQPVPVLNKETLPSLMDESGSSSNLDDTSNVMTSITDDDESATVRETNTKTTDAIEGEEYPGSGVEESKEETSEDTEGQNSIPTSDKESSVERSSSEGEGMPKDEPTQPQATDKEAAEQKDEPPPPLVGYFSWKHTTMNFAQHKMVLHLAKNSDLALHLVLSIIVNQVRSERNHTVFFTTGIHPTWVYPSSWKNPKEMIS